MVRALRHFVPKYDYRFPFSFLYLNTRLMNVADRGIIVKRLKTTL